MAARDGAHRHRHCAQSRRPGRDRALPAEQVRVAARALGVCGRADGDLARPLLCLGAREIRDSCHALGVEYGEDATNASPVYARNVLRLEVIPRLEALNPRLAETLAAAALQAAAEEDVLAAAAAEARARRDATARRP